MFADIVNRPEAEIDLTRAAAMIGLRQYPDLDLDQVARSLDDLATGIRRTWEYYLEARQPGR